MQQRNLQLFKTKMYKTIEGLNPIFMEEIFVKMKVNII